jgi:hypothetical protein
VRRGLLRTGRGGGGAEGRARGRGRMGHRPGEREARGCYSWGARATGRDPGSARRSGTARADRGSPPRCPSDGRAPWHEHGLVCPLAAPPAPAPTTNGCRTRCTSRPLTLAVRGEAPEARLTRLLQVQRPDVRVHPLWMVRAPQGTTTPLRVRHAPCPLAHPYPPPPHTHSQTHTHTHPTHTGCVPSLFLLFQSLCTHHPCVVPHYAKHPTH